MPPERQRSIPKLREDEPRLAFHDGCVVLPGLEERPLIGLVESEHVDQHNRTGIDRELTLDREGRVQRAQ